MKNNANQLFQVNLGNTKIKYRLNSPFYGNISRENTLCVIHNHGQIEFFFLKEGIIKITTLDSKYEFVGPCLVIIPQNLFHFVESTCYVYNMLINIEERITSTNINLFKKFESTFIRSSIISMKVNDFIFSILNEIGNDLKSSLSNNSELIDNLFRTLFLKLINLNESISDEKESLIDYSHEISEYINENYNKDITTKDLAKKLYLSERQVSRLTQKYFNKTFTELLIEKRIAVASFLLSTTDYSMNAIIDIIGFNAQTTFFYNFKKTYKTTPKQYRIEKKKQKE